MVYILPLRHPLEVAKTVGTAALLSGGRVALGCGAGWIREEFDALGVDFETRGERMSEMIEVMRKAWSGTMVEHRGRFFDLGPLQMSPAPPRAAADLRRRPLARRRCAAPRGSATAGSAPARRPTRRSRLVGELRALRAEAGRGAEPFEAIVPLAVPPDAELLRRLEDAGMTATTAWPFPYTIGPRSTLAQKRDAMLRHRGVARAALNYATSC